MVCTGIVEIHCVCGSSCAFLVRGRELMVVVMRFLLTDDCHCFFHVFRNFRLKLESLMDIF